VAKTANNGGLQLNLAVNYSARAELRMAVERLARDVAEGRLDPESIDEPVVASYLSTAEMPDPDLLIRPGGESRLSNFLLYQLADAEMYVTDTLWPDFDREHFARALAAFAERRDTLPARRNSAAASSAESCSQPSFSVRSQRCRRLRSSSWRSRSSRSGSWPDSPPGRVRA
jgi:hypothetical protein